MALTSVRNRTAAFIVNVDVNRESIFTSLSSRRAVLAAVAGAKEYTEYHILLLSILMIDSRPSPERMSSAPSDARPAALYT
jgi:hypothetical protein